MLIKLLCDAVHSAATLSAPLQRSPLCCNTVHSATTQSTLLQHSPLRCVLAAPIHCTHRYPLPPTPLLRLQSAVLRRPESVHCRRHPLFRRSQGCWPHRPRLSASFVTLTRNVDRGVAPSRAQHASPFVCAAHRSRACPARCSPCERGTLIHGVAR